MSKCSGSSTFISANRAVSLQVFEFNVRFTLRALVAVTAEPKGSNMGDEEAEYKAEYLDAAEDAEPEVCG